MADKTRIKPSLHQITRLKEKIKEHFTTSMTNISSFNAASLYRLIGCCGKFLRTMTTVYNSAL
jgi:hypothetical protein